MLSEPENKADKNAVKTKKENQQKITSIHERQKKGETLCGIPLTIPGSGWTT